MAEKKVEKKPEPAAAAKKKFSLKAVLLIAAVLVIEGVAIAAAFMFSGGPANVKAEPGFQTLIDDGEREVELLVVADKFQNAQRGRVYLYDTEIYIVIKKKHQTAMEGEVKAMNAQISTEIARIIGQADPTILLSPDRTTLTRQISAVLDDKLGKNEQGKSRVLKVLVRKCTQFRL